MFSKYLITWFLIEVRQEVSNFDSLMVVHELEVAINRDIYGCLCSLGRQKNIKSLSWSSLTLTAILVALWLVGWLVGWLVVLGLTAL